MQGQSGSPPCAAKAGHETIAATAAGMMRVRGEHRIRHFLPYPACG
ncbi:hypothetical protein SAMCFNEI73_Ch0099 [Sinorhizobium americanum]|uniref:Uncharacterized protein n=1 Tax=Sinorhizobium americanum TaxID=194963 RepID=A0A1L3LHB7_9HYPH|nr:hypothetical protein SAMCFNEI73_Ch0099 [Sinorhizobium americanum]